MSGQSSGPPVRVGLVIVMHNSASDIENCLAAVCQQIRKPDRLVVADSGSTDASLAIVDEVCARLSLTAERLPFADNVGFAVANNRAVEQLTDCELVALLNPDAFPEPGWLAALVDAAAQKQYAASFASRLMVAGTADVLDGAGDAFHVSGLAWRIGYRRPLDDVPEARTPHPVFAACAAAALYRRADWMRTGGFDERFFCYAEDVDLGFRLQLLGRECWYTPDAVARHVGSSATGVDSAFSVYHGYRNLEWTFWKNMPAALLVRYLPVHLLAIAAQLVWFTRKQRGGSVLRAKWDALRQFGGVWRERRRLQRSRTIPVSELRDRLDQTTLRARFKSVRIRRRRGA